MVITRGSLLKPQCSIISRGVQNRNEDFASSPAIELTSCVRCGLWLWLALHSSFLEPVRWQKRMESLAGIVSHHPLLNYYSLLLVESHFLHQDVLMCSTCDRGIARFFIIRIDISIQFKVQPPFLCSCLLQNNHPLP